jgi:ABC-type sugar transport system substrate-binding protein
MPEHNAGDSEPVDPRTDRDVSRRRFIGGAGLTLGGLAASVALPTGSSSAAMRRQLASMPRLGEPLDQKYVWVTANISDPFYLDGIAGMEEFGRLYGVETEIVGPQTNDVAGMTQALEATIADPDTTGIFSYYYADFAGAETLYQQAAEQGIPIVNGAGDWGPPRTMTILAPDADANQAALEIFADTLDEGTTLAFIGNNGANLLRQAEDFATRVEEFPQFEYLGNVIHDGSQADALAQYENFLSTNPDLGALFFGDGLGAGIADALVDVGPDVSIILRGFGQVGLDAIQRGDVLAAVDRSTFDEEFWGFMGLYFWVNGSFRTPDVMNLSTIRITADNVEAFLEDPYRRS